MANKITDLVRKRPFEALSEPPNKKLKIERLSVGTPFEVPAGIFFLPNELWVYIFSFFSLEEIKKASLAGRFFFHITSDDQIWKRFYNAAFKNISLCSWLPNWPLREKFLQECLLSKNLKTNRATQCEISLNSSETWLSSHMILFPRFLLVAESKCFLLIPLGEGKPALRIPHEIQRIKKIQKCNENTFLLLSSHQKEHQLFRFVLTFEGIQCTHQKSVENEPEFFFQLPSSPDFFATTHHDATLKIWDTHGLKPFETYPILPALAQNFLRICDIDKSFILIQTLGINDPPENTFHLLLTRTSQANSSTPLYFVSSSGMIPYTDKIQVENGRNLLVNLKQDNIYVLQNKHNKKIQCYSENPLILSKEHSFPMIFVPPARLNHSHFHVQDASSFYLLLGSSFFSFQEKQMGRLLSHFQSQESNERERILWSRADGILSEVSVENTNHSYLQWRTPKTGEKSHRLIESNGTILQDYGWVISLNQTMNGEKKLTVKNYLGST